MRRKKLKITSLFSLLLLTLTSCTLGGQGNTISFDGVKYALYFSPTTVDFNDFSPFTPNYGYVLLIDEEGKHQRIRTDGMAGGKLSWGSANELSFADRSYNYVVKENSIEKFEAPKTDLQNDIAVSGGRYVSTFNLGGKIGAYKNQFTLTDTSGTELETITESVESLATCPDGRIIGGGSNLGPTRNFAEETFLQVIVSQVYDGENLAVEPLWKYTAPNPEIESISYFGLVCTETDVHLLLVPADDESITDLSLASVDLATGQATIKPLGPDQEYGGNNSPAVIVPSLYGGRYLDWYIAGKVYRTDVSTGVTQLFIELEGGEKSLSSQVTADDRFIYKLVRFLKPDGSVQGYVINRYDREDGALTERLELAPLKGVDGMEQYGFAPRPRS